MKAKVTFSRADRESLAKLSAVEQANLVYDLMGHIADRLADMGIRPSIIAQATYDLGRELEKRDGSPVEVVRIDPRRIRGGQAS
jgi:hypothetical protein